ncbi:MAG: SLBB domain-containing protein, partial [Bythopirellula sp.]
MNPIVILHEKIKPLALVLSLAWVAGCQSGTYQARHLPNEFRSLSQKKSPQQINLARAAAPGASEAVLAPGDLLAITVTTSRKDEKAHPILARVADDGSVDVPVIGPVPVAGMEAYEASQNIASLGIQRGMYRHPLVTVEIESKAVNRITVLGAVKKPGVHELPRGGSDLVSALAAAGGLEVDAGSLVEIIRQSTIGYAQVPTPNAAGNGVAGNGAAGNGAGGNQVQLAAYQQVGRAGPPRPSVATNRAQTIKIDLAESNSVPTDLRLFDRDVVRIAPRPIEVIHVTGLVHKPGQFELPIDQDIHLLDAVALAGGRNSPVADKVFVLRHVENQAEPLVIQASLSQAKQYGAENLRIT